MGISTHILQQPDFWTAFSDEVEMKERWRCYFPENILTEKIRDDAAFYAEDTIFMTRRQGVSVLSKNDVLWTTTVLGACKELAEGKEGKCSLELKKLHVLTALRDYITHLDFFYKVASVMDSRSENSCLTDLRITPVHDIDKLHPAMLVAYSEKFDDNQDTSLWLTCVDNHTRKNPHHQAHPLWTECCQCCSKSSQGNTRKCSICDEARSLALREMVCDKVSRKVQKELGGKICDEMWDIDVKFYAGLPERWLAKATELAQFMKRQGR